MRKLTAAVGAAVILALSLAASPAMATQATTFRSAELGPIGVTLTAEACGALVGTDVLADDGDQVTATIASATVISSDAGEPACSIEGTIEGRIGFTVQLPLSDWNGRYFQTGCGGFCGYTPIASCASALDGGFAVGAEDTGHVDPTGGAEWALDDDQAERDWGYLSPHLLAVVAKSLIEDVYGQPASTSYFQGCSTGGRQALIEAQRYPDDFDGIVSGAPALYQNYLATLSQGGYEMANRRADGTAILDAAAVTVLSDAVQAACGDGNGVVADPASCDFSPVTVQCADAVDTDCLTAEQVATVEAMYTAPVASDGTVLYPGGMPLGSEALWMGWAVGTDGAYSGGGGYAQNVLRYLAFEEDPGAAYDLAQFDPDDYRMLEAKAEIYNADDADLSKFAAGGGKLILYHGLADPLITPYGTIDYFESLIDADGGATVTDQYARLFLLPGVGHCSGGPGEDTVDWLASIVAWVEDGVAPASITAAKLDSAGAATSTRTIVPFASGSADARLSDWFGRPIALGSNPVDDADAEPSAAPVSPALEGGSTSASGEELAETGPDSLALGGITAALLLGLGVTAIAVALRRSA